MATSPETPGQSSKRPAGDHLESPKKRLTPSFTSSPSCGDLKTMSPPSEESQSQETEPHSDERKPFDIASLPPTDQITRAILPPVEEWTYELGAELARRVGFDINFEAGYDDGMCDRKFEMEPDRDSDDDDNDEEDDEEDEDDDSDDSEHDEKDDGKDGKRRLEVERDAKTGCNQDSAGSESSS